MYNLCKIKISKNIYQIVSVHFTYYLMTCLPPFINLDFIFVHRYGLVLCCVLHKFQRFPETTNLPLYLEDHVVRGSILDTFFLCVCSLVSRRGDLRSPSSRQLKICKKWLQRLFLTWWPMSTNVTDVSVSNCSPTEYCVTTDKMYKVEDGVVR